MVIAIKIARCAAILNMGAKPRFCVRMNSLSSGHPNEAGRVLSFSPNKRGAHLGSAAVKLADGVDCFLPMQH
jgi:hypothetical protein